jgi:AmmeMemoRadiSam system protein A
MEAMQSTRLDPAARRALLSAASRSIEVGLGLDEMAAPPAGDLCGVLAEPRSSFVTLTIAGHLRGCCGTLEPLRPLLLDVWGNAEASAFRDPRFPPLTAHEWVNCALEVSVLTPCERMAVVSEQQLLRELVPGRDGLVLQWHGTRATFLPKVWDQVAGPHEFLERLKRKAGLAGGFWDDELRFWRYETELVSAGSPRHGTAA